MSVANMTFLVNKLGEDCSPLQFVRELTANSIQGIQLTGGPGEIVWDVNWPHYELDGVYKLACIDTGIGMTGDDMVQYINKLSSSIHERKSGRWSLQELELLWGEEALTAAVLPRWHINQSIKRHLGQRVGTLRAA